MAGRRHVTPEKQNHRAPGARRVTFLSPALRVGEQIVTLAGWPKSFASVNQNVLFSGRWSVSQKQQSRRL